jgi:hypothetical protein
LPHAIITQLNISLEENIASLNKSVANKQLVAIEKDILVRGENFRQELTLLTSHTAANYSGLQAHAIALALTVVLTRLV